MTAEHSPLPDVRRGGARTQRGRRKSEYEYRDAEYEYEDVSEHKDPGYRDQLSRSDLPAPRPFRTRTQ